MKRSIFLITSIIVNCPFYFFIDSFTSDASAASLEITNSSVALGDTYAYTRHKIGAKENHDSSFDSFYNSGSPAKLQIYIHNNTSNEDLSADARSLNSITPFDIKLKAKSLIANADNSLKFQVDNTDGAFNHRRVIAYNITEPTNIHEIPKNGDIIEVTLPTLVNQPAGIYANWRVEMPRIIEGDINEDGTCDFLDIMVLANEWLQTSDPAQNGGNYLTSDVNLDRVTDFRDLAIISRDFGKSE